MGELPRAHRYPDAAPALIELARATLASAQHVVVLTGAGISTESGIPDFRGPDGVWTRDPQAEQLSRIEVYRSRPDVRERAWKMRMSHPAWQAEPNAAHLALAAAQGRGKVDLVVTQNTDGLHLRAGTPEADLVEIHGSVRRVRCLSCGVASPAREVVDRVRAGEADPACQRCGGILKTDVIFFGEALVAEDLERAFLAAEDCEVLVAIGTTLQVYPIAEMVPIAKASGASIIVINGEPTAMDGIADVVVRGSITAAVVSVFS